MPVKQMYKTGSVTEAHKSGRLKELTDKYMDIHATIIKSLKKYVRRLKSRCG
jgi:hypothetical protein